MLTKRISKSILCVAFGAATLLLNLAGVHAATLTWDPGDQTNGSTIDPGSGTWNTTAGNTIWNNGTSDVVWSQTSGTAGTNTAVFGGADGTYTVTVGTALAATGIQILNSGYTLSAASSQTISLSSSGAVFSVASGKTANIGNNVTVNYLATGNFNGGGTLNIGGGTAAAKLTMTASNTLAISGTGTLIDVKTNGTLAQSASATSKTAIATTTGDDVTVQIDGGTVALAGNNMTSVYQLSAAAGASSGTLTINTGTFSINSAQKLQGLATAVNASNTATINLNGGTMTVPAITPGAGTTNLNFNGGTLQEVNTDLAASFVTAGTGTTTLSVRNGGAIIDSQAFNPTITPAFVHSTVATDNTTDGGLTKKGAGILTLPATNTYTGPTNVSAGTLLLSTTGSINASSTVNVAASGALTLNNATALDDAGTLDLVSGTSSAKTTLTLGAGSGTTETISYLVLDGTVEPAGVYTAAQLAALDTNVGLSFVSGSGETLTVTVPEPETSLGGLFLVGGIAVRYRRRLKGLLAGRAV